MKDIREFLPIGTVVVLKNGTKKLMIFGIIQSNAEDPGEEYDYIGVPWYLDMNSGGTPHSTEEIERVKSLLDAERN